MALVGDFLSILLLQCDKEGLVCEVGLAWCTLQLRFPCCWWQKTLWFRFIF